MKKSLIFLIVMVFTLSASVAFAGNTNPKSASDRTAVPAKTENTLTVEEVNRLTKRVEEIRVMDKSNLTKTEKSELKKELKETKKDLKKNNGTIVIGGTTLILIIILVIILL